MKRLDTKLESTGAEFLVLGNLLIEGISAYKAYQNFPCYDLVGVNPENNTSVKIQVKSRFRTDWDGFIIKNFDCDFVVFVTLNRGYKVPKKSGEVGRKAPEYYVFPIKYVKKIRDLNNKWGKIQRNKMVGYEKFKDQWELINVFLKTK
jgi:hypothetical protein